MPRRNARYTPLDVDGPVPLEMLRAVRGIRRDALAFLAECVRRYGDLVAFPLPRTPVLLVNDPDGVRRVLLEGHGRYGKATVQYTSLSLVTGIGLLTAEQEQWRPRRRVDQPAFRHSALPDVAASAARAASGLRGDWDRAPGNVLDAEQAVLRAMLDVVTETLFDADLETVAPGEHLGRRLVEAVDDALHVVINRAQLPLPPWLARRSRSRLARANAVLDDACARIVAARRARGVDEQDGDLLALLLRAVQAGVLSEGEVRDELVTMVIAGHETVASALTWALHLLATHPHIQDRLAHELDALADRSDGALADRSDGAPAATWAPGWDDLAKLPYTRAVLDETLRLYPPAWVITRTALEVDTVAGVAVPAGTLVIICPWLLHRREQTWPDPQRFDPERFLTRRGGSRPSGDYLPFGLGPRLCIGRDFALVEGVLVLAGLLRGREVLPAGGHPGVSDVRLDALVTLRPHGGMPLRLRERHPGSARES